MKRSYLPYLQEWLVSRDRRPLVIRGDRQVGKTWLVRYFDVLKDKRLIEVNYLKHTLKDTLFGYNYSKQIILYLFVALSKQIIFDQCILFLDEIQAVPELLTKLRWFAEDMPELPVIAAGSLLEFVLEQHSFSMPVGRITYMHMEPLSFEEFLQACSKSGLVDYLHSFQWEMTIPFAIHEQDRKSVV